MVNDRIYIPRESPFLEADTRKKRWAIPYDFDCLNARIDQLLGRHQDAITGKYLLDVGSHIGTFAYAAHKLGARRILGIDSEKRTVLKCKELFRMHNIPESSCFFETVEACEFLEKVEPDSFDTILCFGALYYTPDPYRLIQLMARAARETILLDTFTAAYAAIQGKDSAAVYPRISEETLELPLMIVSLTQPEKRDYRLPDAFSYRGKELSMITLPTRALLEIWFQSLNLEYNLINWSRHIQRPRTFRDMVTPQQKKDSHWADVYASEIRVSYRLSTIPG